MNESLFFEVVVFLEFELRTTDLCCLIPHHVTCRRHAWRIKIFEGMVHEVDHPWVIRNDCYLGRFPGSILARKSLMPEKLSQPLFCFPESFRVSVFEKGETILRIRNQWVIIHVAKMNHCTELVSCLHFKLFNATRGSQSVLINPKMNSKCPVCPLSEPKSCDSHSFNPYKKSFLITESKQS